MYRLTRFLLRLFWTFLQSSSLSLRLCSMTTASLQWNFVRTFRTIYPQTSGTSTGFRCEFSVHNETKVKSKLTHQKSHFKRIFLLFFLSPERNPPTMIKIKNAIISTSFYYTYMQCFGSEFFSRIRISLFSDSGPDPDRPKIRIQSGKIRNRE